MYKYDKDSTNLPLYEKNFQLIRNYFIALEKNCLKWQDYRTNIDYEFAYFAKFFLELYKRDLTEPFSYYIFAAYSEDNEEIRNYLNNNSSKVLPLEEFIENYNWDQILE
jgi:hypothetical protein